MAWSWTLPCSTSPRWSTTAPPGSTYRSGSGCPRCWLPPGDRSAVLDDVDWDAVDYLDDTSWLQVPALVLHTTEDTTVPISSSRELVDVEPGLVRLVELEGEHAGGYTTDPERYLREVRRLLAEVA